MDNPREIFDRMSNRLEFDACEMSSSELISRYAANKLPFVAHAGVCLAGVPPRLHYR